MGQLRHPHIVTVHYVGRTEEGSGYIVTQYVEGGNLAARFVQGKLRHTEITQIVAFVAEALQYAHERNVFHRDVKPANILLDDLGKPYLTDFGLALREEDLLRERSRRIGTVAYMSPEQARGDFIAGRSDLFSLGVIFYEGLTRSRPFVANHAEELLQLISTTYVRPPQSRDGTIPDELDRICMKALSLRVQDRYSSAGAMARDLRNWLQSVQGSQENLSNVQPREKSSFVPVTLKKDTYTPAEGSPLNTLGGYQLQARIGSGGMGVVYRAWKPLENRTVALKCLRLTETETRRRFLNEIKFLGQVKHPNVVEILHSGEN